jgi:hypothetical protein
MLNNYLRCMYHESPCRMTFWLNYSKNIMHPNFHLKVVLFHHMSNEICDCGLTMINNTRLISNLGFQIGNFRQRNQIWRGGWRAKKNPCHFGHVDFIMSNVIRVVFLTGRIKAIWLIILMNEYWTNWMVKWFK